jgi:uncharacterized protein YfkK (UPF0435 family)
MRRQKGGVTMDLTNKSEQNVTYMIEAIKTKLRMASGAALNAERFDEEKYEDLKDLYDLVASKDRFSVSEIDAIVAELGKLRKA